MSISEIVFVNNIVDFSRFNVVCLFIMIYTPFNEERYLIVSWSGSQCYGQGDRVTVRLTVSWSW